MFGRGNWAIFGIETDSYSAFLSKLSDPAAMLAVSQLAATAVTRYLKQPADGINPYSAPRLDESKELDSLEGNVLANYAAQGEEARLTNLTADALVQNEAFAHGAEAYRLHDSVPLFGFWFVENQWKDVSDIPSLKEQKAYIGQQRPYKFLSIGDKKVVDQEVAGVTAPTRKQFPVLVDFLSGRFYVENTNKGSLYLVTQLFSELGIEFLSVAWDFASDSWPSQVTSKLYADSNFKDQFKKVAEDAGRFKEEEREPIEDPEMRGILRDYFSMTQLESELWAGLSSPAQVKLHKTLAPIVVQSPISATLLLDVTEDATATAASVTFQERIAVTKKSGEERIFRKDVLTFDINDNINLTEVGAALLRGFDMPAFRRDILRDIKKTKQVPSVQEFWQRWLIGMADAIRTIEVNLRDILEIKDKPSGIRPIYTESKDEVIESA